MDDRTKQALLGSIAKWEAIVQGIGSDAASDNCPLCVEFADQIDPEAERDEEGHLPENAGCHGCPVKVAAGGLSDCIGTPYVAWMRAVPWRFANDSIDAGRHVETDAHRELAQAELDFLRGLLGSETAP